MTRTRELSAVLEDGESLAIVCHDNPDPDTLASGMALGRIARHVGVSEVDVLYAGSISHQQNRAFVNLFDLDLREYEPADLEAYDLLALVDHAVPGRNNGVPPDADVDVVIDHHSAEGVRGRFVDHREELGASATILVEYLRELGIEPGEDLATALTFAIRRETLEFLRGATTAEYDAARFLHGSVDTARLRQLASPPLTPGTIDAIGDAIDNRVIRSSCLVSHVGRTEERDALPQAADYLVTLEGITTTVVAGIVDDAVHLSARSTSPDRDVGAILRRGFDDIGSAGGHDDMAGGQVPLGLFADWATDESGMTGLVGQLVARRVFDAMNLSPEERTGRSEDEELVVEGETEER